MIDANGRVSGRVAALCVVMVMAFGVVACGSDDGDTDAGDGAAAAPTQKSSSDGGDSASSDAAGTPQQGVKAAYEEFSTALRAKQFDEACGVFSKSFQKQYPASTGFPGNCVTAMRAEFGKNAPGGDKPQVVKVKVVGPREATGFVKTRPDSENLLPLRFVKQGGAWKMDGAAKES